MIIIWKITNGPFIPCPQRQELKIEGWPFNKPCPCILAADEQKKKKKKQKEKKAKTCVETFILDAKIPTATTRWQFWEKEEEQGCSEKRATCRPVNGFSHHGMPGSLSLLPRLIVSAAERRVREVSRANRHATRKVVLPRKLAGKRTVCLTLGSVFVEWRAGARSLPVCWCLGGVNKSLLWL